MVFSRFLVCLLAVLVWRCPASVSRAQSIQCLDTLTSDGFFFQVQPTRGFTAASGTADHYSGYFISRAAAAQVSVDTLFARALHQLNDIVKYLAFPPRLPAHLRTHLTGPCAGAYDHAVSLLPRLQPAVAVAIRSPSRHEKGAQMRFSYVRVRWLHLRIQDRVAFDYFNAPYSLATPYIASKWYDVYLPLHVLTLNNTVRVNSHRRVVY